MEVMAISSFFPLALKMNLKSKCFSVGPRQWNYEWAVLQDCFLRENAHTSLNVLIISDAKRKGICEFAGTLRLNTDHSNFKIQKNI